MFILKIWPIFFFLRNWLSNKINQNITNKYKVLALKIVIRTVKPDIIHSLEFQHAGYMTLAAKKDTKKNFPPWIATNWGSDIYLFWRIPEHKKIIRQLLNNCDYYACECDRDVDLVKSLGYKGEILPVLPNTGGIELDEFIKFHEPGLTSKRRKIILKAINTGLVVHWLHCKHYETV